ncbi:MAG: transporter, partial [Cypionkella sp.]|uniref:TOBE domain-containing protein n=1 Tax=Cypionkella sp. TaxID=2811411 RepID=UPI002608BD51
KVTVGGQTVQLTKAVEYPDTDGSVSLALRPEAISLIPSASRDVTFEGMVKSVNFMGSVIRIRMDVGAEAISFDMFNSPNLVAPAIGQTALAHFASTDMFEVSA